MNPLIGELKNVLTAGRVVGPVTPDAYYLESDKRGDPLMLMGRSSLMEFYRCPKRWLNGYESEDSKATEWGSLVDCLFLTPGQFKDRYAVSPATYPSEGMKCPNCGSVTNSKTCKKCSSDRIKITIDKPWDRHASFCAEWEESQAPRQCIKSTLFGPACDAVKVMDDDLVIKSLVECSQKQIMATASYADEETGVVVPLKILIDLLPAVDSPWGKSIVDLKTLSSASPREHGKSVFNFNLHVQAALYLDVWTACTGEDRVEFRHIVQESYAPYHTEKRILSAEFVEIGRAKYQEALKAYCQCLSTNTWPGYPETRLNIDGWNSIDPEPYMVQ